MKNKTEQKLKMCSVKQLASRSHHPYMHLKTIIIIIISSSSSISIITSETGNKIIYPIKR